MTERQANGPVAPETGAEDQSAASEPAGAADGAANADAEADMNSATGAAADSVTIDEAALADLETALQNSRIELERTQERYVRLAAEFDNYRKRTERERVEAYGRAQADIIARLLDAVDDLERVADFDETTPSTALLEGVQLVEKKLLTAFEAAGLKRMNAAGQRFDPATMEALATVQAESQDEDDIVSDVFQAGYTFGGMLVRPARVRVKQYED